MARGAHVYNCAALVHGGKILGIVPKEKLPTYNVFYEARVFARGAPGLVDEVHGVPFGDLVFDFDFGSRRARGVRGPLVARRPDAPPLVRRRRGRLEPLGLAVTASVSSRTRREMIATRAATIRCTVVYTNLVGANDGLVFDGGGFVAQNGRIVARRASLHERLRAR